jgi:molecular chaperone Hsp33
MNWREVINKVLADSFQMKSLVMVSQDSDQSVMCTALPPVRETEVQASPGEYWLKNAGAFNELFARALNGPEEIVPALEKMGLKFLAARDIAFHCPCSESSILGTLRALVAAGEDILPPDEDSIQTTCDYCHAVYTFSRGDISTSS